MGKRLVIVESPTKARTIHRFLGKDYVVKASMGHVRDLPDSARQVPAQLKGEPWARLGVDVARDFAPLYVIPADKKRPLEEIRRELQGAEELLLATDEDREGESISWHLVEVLRPRVPQRRLVFHEITREAIQRALESPRAIDMRLVRAQETRRIVDRLFGYEVSPLLWKKIAPRLSAGRVQSAAIRLLVDRERERMRFRPASWWDLLAELAPPRAGGGEPARFEATLLEHAGRRLATGRDFDPETGRLSERAARAGVLVLERESAQRLRARLAEAAFEVRAVETRPFTRRPEPPFTTSTLQQEGGRKLGWSARRTMQVAQRLYEAGYITYMRTDSTTLSAQAIEAARAAVEEMYGRDYLAPAPRQYRSQVKNAQEAHEAIRPAGERFRTPASLRGELGPDELRLYELIWKRTMACQMADARGERITVLIQAASGGEVSIFQASGRAILFPGFLRAYVEGSDDPDAELAERETLLPRLREGERLELLELRAQQHSTQPPPRYTEAALVKALEAHGIGRPSTYASIIDTIERRDYTFKKGTTLVPTFTAFAVVQLLERHFPDLVDLGYTARMEDHLDAIARGEKEYLPYLREFYFGDGDRGLHRQLAAKIDQIDAREVCTVPLGQTPEGTPVVVRVGRYGPYLQVGERTANLPEGIAPDELTVERALELVQAQARGERPLGLHPQSGEPIFVKTGRYGPYLQLGEGGGAQGASGQERLAAARPAARGGDAGAGGGAAGAAAHPRRRPGERRSGGGRDRALRAVCAVRPAHALARARGRRAADRAGARAGAARPAPRRRPGSPRADRAAQPGGRRAAGRRRGAAHGGALWAVRHRRRDERDAAPRSGSRGGDARPRGGAAGGAAAEARGGRRRAAGARGAARRDEHRSKSVPERSADHGRARERDPEQDDRQGYEQDQGQDQEQGQEQGQDQDEEQRRQHARPAGADRSPGPEHRRRCAPGAGRRAASGRRAGRRCGLARGPVPKRRAGGPGSSLKAERPSL
ncbi:MAG: hypothetical protein KatS3mg102_1429 [Planctomycetota bacterium]|nr:MAG: hypothetical protein KatS3mg102_1429 [Planctomycetota bacterium]